MEVLQQAGFTPWPSLSSYLLSLVDLQLIIYLQKISEEVEAKSFSFGEFWGCWPFLCWISYPPLSEAVHILLTRPFTHQFQPKRRPWPHLTMTAQIQDCVHTPPKFPSSVIDQIFAFLKADNICELTIFSHKALSPGAIYLQSTKANWFLLWQPDPGSQLSPLLQFLVWVFVLDSFGEQKRIMGRRGSVQNKSV